MKSFGIIIPARYASTRFPGKPLQDLGGKSMIQRVVEAAKFVAPHAGVAVATDDIRIAEHVADYCEVVMTSSVHPSGTDRCAEALEKLGWNCEIVVNLQGDEPFIKTQQIHDLVAAFNDPIVQIATLKKWIQAEEDINNPNVVKVVCSNQNKALYFSRSTIPYQRNNENSQLRYFKHLGVYAFLNPILKEVVQLPVSTLESTEMLEQLRWLENGYHISVIETNFASPAVDTPDDVAKAMAYLNSMD